ncbi:hypothetical protein LJK87_31790 [Paenibacillus sp. P25]|nr:hypothetical protein LJK87_31790 [Paenibacillus sp. P25]
MILTGFLMIAFAVQPLLAALIIGIGPGMLFPINLLLPIDEAGNARQAAAWSAMTQSVGYVIGALGPILLGSVHDAVGSYSGPMIAMIAIVLLMIAVQLALPCREKDGKWGRA